jgi:hypothetical protein
MTIELRRILGDLVAGAGGVAADLP